MHHIIYSLITIILAFAGFAIAAFISGKVKAKDNLVCPLRTECNTVVHSRHSGFLGVKVTTWGMLYYGIILIGSVFMMSVPVLAAPGITFLIVVASVIAFVFSLYLTAVQAFVIRQWCSWCITSAIISALILLVTFLHLGSLVIVLLGYFRILLFMGYVLGLMMGVGGSIIYTVLFFKFLRDYRLSGTEKETLNAISIVIVTGLGIVLVTGLGLFIPLAGWYAVNPEFMLAAIIGAVLAIQTIIVKTDIIHQLSDLYESNVIPADDDHAYTRKKSYALGAVGLVSWITLGIVSLINFRISFVALLSVYLVAIIGAVLWSQISEYRVYQRSIGQ